MAIDTVLSGRISYAIIANRLLLYGRHGAIVSYVTSGCAGGFGCSDTAPVTATAVSSVLASTR